MMYNSKELPTKYVSKVGHDQQRQKVSLRFYFRYSESAMTIVSVIYLYLKLNHTYR